MKNICIIGTGGFSRECLCLLTDLGLYDKVECFMEPDKLFKQGRVFDTVMGKPVFSMNKFNPTVNAAVIGIGNSVIREKTVKEQLPKETTYPIFIHPSAVVSKWANLGRGTIIGAGTIITSQISIGEFSHLNLGTTIGHDCHIQSYFTTAPSVNISGICTIGKHVYFGTGAATKQGVTICDEVTIGMGAMVVKNIDESGTYIGIPAKKK